MIMIHLFVTILLLSCLITHKVSGRATIPVTVGGVLSNRISISILNREIAKLNEVFQQSSDELYFNASSILMDDNPIRAALTICDDLIPSGVHVVIISHLPENNLSPISVSYTCVYYWIPVIGISSRDSIFSDKNIHTSFLRTVPPYSQQADVWVSLARFFRWKKVLILFSGDQEGRAILAKFQNKAEADKNSVIEIEKGIDLPPGLNSYEHVLEQMISTNVRVLLVYASQKDCETLFKDAVALNMTEGDFIWIVTEQCLDAPSIPLGFIGTELQDSSDEEKHIKDAVNVIATAFKAMHRSGQGLSPPVTECNDSADVLWDSGSRAYTFLKEAVIENGATGRVEFNDVGDRVFPRYTILNTKNNGTKSIIGTFQEGKNNNDYLIIYNDTAITWPGGLKTRPPGVKIDRHLEVTTLAERPFVYAEPGQDCPIAENKVYCPRLNLSSGAMEHFCCYGYCVELLLKLAAEVNFTFSLHLNPEQIYGDFVSVNLSNNGVRKQWNGMVGELTCPKNNPNGCSAGYADLVAAPLTITPERARDIDFSKPFKYQGYTILVKKWQKISGLGSFMQPFQDTLWILVGLSVHLVALVLYLLDRFSPFGRFKLARASTDDDEGALNLSTAIWFAWGVLLNSGIGEGTPRSFSGRVLGMVWAGFAMIIVASYTANLAAFLVLDRPEMSSLSGIDDARLRNPVDTFKYATVRDSAVSQYFKRQVELSTMYRTMEKRNYDSAELAINAVISDELQAFIWDSSRLEFEAAGNCQLTTAGELFGRSGYGIALRKDSYWTRDISISILGFHEKGDMEAMDNRWILRGNQDCEEKDSSPATLDLSNMAGVFMMVAGGIMAGIVLIFVEIAYKRHRGLKEREMALARTAADKWRRTIENRKVQRFPIMELQTKDGRQKRKQQRLEQELFSKYEAETSIVHGLSPHLRHSPVTKNNRPESPVCTNAINGSSDRAQLSSPLSVLASTPPDTTPTGPRESNRRPLLNGTSLV